MADPISYTSCYQIARTALVAEQNYFTALQQVAVVDTDALKLQLALNDLGDQIDLLDSHYQALLTEIAGPAAPPPDPKMLQKAQDLATALAQDIVKKTSAQAIVTRTAAFLTLWSQLGTPAQQAAVAKAVAKSASE